MTNETEQNTIKEFYEEIYYKDAKPPTTTTDHLRKLAIKMGLKQGDQVLDIACGTGNWLLACREKGATVAGVDLSERAIEACKQAMPEGHFYSANAEMLNFKDNSFDLVTCLGSLEHFIDPGQALDEMVRVLKDNGELLLLVPNKDFLTRKLLGFKGTYQKDVREVARTIEQWQSLFFKSDITVISKWKDLHVLSRQWITIGSAITWPARLLQALLLAVWPLRWQYQIYFRCKKADYKTH
ncbi:class I SAM-dependent methyltransferase [Halioxenophilus sp. WMMB6]|uniref:class I SAM-dependent methyltransferase n=1 Tax=Halioxenophilus sp. WMMB6 TaxID=3073815 RepID=UPI00295EF0C8|nr:class I SAM-dependent methyltransferase [Halioxenophilus sp. WMMB6]